MKALPLKWRWRLRLLALAALVLALPLYALAQGQGRDLGGLSLLGLLLIALIVLLRSVDQLAREPLINIASALDALRHGDTQFRAGFAGQSPELDALHIELERLRQARADARSSVAVQQLAIAQLAEHWPGPLLQIDGNDCLRSANAAAAVLLPDGIARSSGLPVQALGLRRHNGHWQADAATPAAAFVWRALYLPGEKGHCVLLAQDLRQELAEQEQQAWQKLIRVLSHEVRNSLTPIRSLAQSLREQTLDAAARQQALAAIEARADHLSQFIARYAQLARLPAPQITPLRWSALRAGLLPLAPLDCQWPEHGPTLRADAQQLEALLINLLCNAAEAGATKVVISVREQSGVARICLHDNGRGIANPDNLFVPLYSTKPEGGGIGLLLCRQIARAHGGELQLQNASDGGAIAVLDWPLA